MDAVARIHKTSRRLPRAVNNLAVQALIAAYAAGASIVDKRGAYGGHRGHLRVTSASGNLDVQHVTIDLGLSWMHTVRTVVDHVERDGIGPYRGTVEIANQPTACASMPPRGPAATP